MFDTLKPGAIYPKMNGTVIGIHREEYYWNVLEFDDCVIAIPKSMVETTSIKVGSVVNVYPCSIWNEIMKTMERVMIDLDLLAGDLGYPERQDGYRRVVQWFRDVRDCKFVVELVS